MLTAVGIRPVDSSSAGSLTSTTIVCGSAGDVVTTFCSSANVYCFDVAAVLASWLFLRLSVVVKCRRGWRSRGMGWWWWCSRGRGRRGTRETILELPFHPAVVVVVVVEEREPVRCRVRVSEQSPLLLAILVAQVSSVLLL